MIRFSPARGLTLALLPALAILIGLGVWQVQRLQWKTQMLAQITAGEDAAPERLADILARKQQGEMIAWRRVSVRGVLADQTPQALFANREGRPAVRLLAPFITTDGLTIVLDLGYERPARETKLADEWRLPGAAQERRLQGILKPIPRPSRLAPVNIDGQMWYTPDTARLLAGLQHGTPITDYVLSIEGPPQHPQWPDPAPGHAQIANNHLDYALTWFGLALAAIGIYLGWHVRAERLSSGKDAA